MEAWCWVGGVNPISLQKIAPVSLSGRAAPHAHKEAWARELRMDHKANASHSHSNVDRSQKKAGRAGLWV